jgi:hypothetical protein
MQRAPQADSYSKMSAELAMSTSNTTLATIFDGQVVLTSPLNLPNGTQVEVVPVSVPGPAAREPDGWPEGYFAATAGQLAGDEFERPSQGTQTERVDW